MSPYRRRENLRWHPGNAHRCLLMWSVSSSSTSVTRPSTPSPSKLCHHYPPSGTYEHLHHLEQETKRQKDRGGGGVQLLSWQMQAKQGCLASNERLKSHQRLRLGSHWLPPEQGIYNDMHTCEAWEHKNLPMVRHARAMPPRETTRTTSEQERKYLPMKEPPPHEAGHNGKLSGRCWSGKAALMLPGSCLACSQPRIATTPYSPAIRGR